MRHSTAAGKRLAWSHLPIQVADQGKPGELVEDVVQDTSEGNTVVQRDFSKKRDSSLPKPVDQQRQVPVSNSPVVGTGPGLTERKQAARREDSKIGASPSDRSTGGATIRGPQAGVSVFGVSPDGRTRHPNTLELIGRIGKKTWRFLLDSGSTGNYISTQVCTAHRVRIEGDPYPDQLTMADGSKIETEGRVQIRFHCGEYQGTVQAKVFPGLQKPMILGIPWLRKENPHIDWTQGTVTVRKGPTRIQLPLVTPKREPSEQLLNMVSATQVSKILRKKPATRAFVGIVRKVMPTVEEREGKTQSDLYSS